MSRPARDYLVYACEGCGKRIFTDRGFLGRTGVCPCCGRKHVVGGMRVADESSDRRGAPRVTDEHALVTLTDKPRHAILHDELFPLGDISETGIGFQVAGVPDPRHLSGVRPPPLREGDVIDVTLHSAEQFRPRTYQAKVARVVAGKLADKGLYLIGAEFVGLKPKQVAELKSMVERLQAKDDG